MKILDYKKRFIENLTQIYDEREAESFFYLLLEAFSGMRRIDLSLNPTKDLATADLEKWNDALDNLMREVPIQYLIGSTHFYGLTFKVNEGVLIPRSETEELVDWIITDSKAGQMHTTILDIGTGSGCIAISLAKNLASDVTAIDVSEAALKIANTNADLNGVDVRMLQQNILVTENLDMKYDIIVSNPPYVRQLEKHEIRRNVLEHEPHLALFVSDENALLFYDKIATLAIENLTDGGALYFEINQYLAKETMDLLEQKGFSFLELRKDLFGNDRMIKAMLS